MEGKDRLIYTQALWLQKVRRQLTLKILTLRLLIKVESLLLTTYIAGYNSKLKVGIQLLSIISISESSLFP